MHLAFIGLAHGKGTVRVYRDGDRYTVHHDSGGQAIAAETIDYIDGEAAEDAKARAVGAVRMLDHWPKLIASLAAERRITDAKAGRIKVPPRHTGARSGVILPR